MFTLVVFFYFCLWNSFLLFLWCHSNTGKLGLCVEEQVNFTELLTVTACYTTLHSQQKTSTMGWFVFQLCISRFQNVIVFNIVVIMLKNNTLYESSWTWWQVGVWCYSKEAIKCEFVSVQRDFVKLQQVCSRIFAPVQLIRKFHFHVIRELCKRADFAYLSSPGVTVHCSQFS